MTVCNDDNQLSGKVPCKITFVFQLNCLFRSLKYPMWWKYCMVAAITSCWMWFPLFCCFLQGAPQQTLTPRASYLVVLSFPGSSNLGILFPTSLFLLWSRLHLPLLAFISITSFRSEHFSSDLLRSPKQNLNVFSSAASGWTIRKNKLWRWSPFKNVSR